MDPRKDLQSKAVTSPATPEPASSTAAADVIRKSPVPAYIYDDAVRMAQRYEMVQWASRMLTDRDVAWLDFDAACHARGFSPTGKLAATFFHILYGMVPVCDDMRLRWRSSASDPALATFPR